MPASAMGSLPASGQSPSATPPRIRYQRLVEGVAEFDELTSVFDGSASLVKGELRGLIREELGLGSDDDEPITDPDEAEQHSGGGQGEQDGGQGKLAIPAPAPRLRQVRLTISDLAVAKANNLQPYLFRVLQQQDAGAEVQLSILVRSEPGIPEDILDRQIVEAFEQLGVSVSWEA